ncbi:aldose epimerase [Gloeocapsopsis dulcis]|uniref:Aldose epimerase n=1 Tax=Gloeocapsopsis dulcis AAB1 = 1H9 TaxID=1433147 RepID=A0A6N8FS96_9CHRO|nr:aldose epimerase [Gloeocapsopsis dulcis]MUL35963.1 aldose epimerase [Gloeocapsopsis dulcis AAB1 = 1H9]WNN88216.1 aldose epimerase [Gloeocapsopsis dulcis]
MFAIASSQKQYKTYTLSDQAANSLLEVVPERGGIVTRWSIQGQEMLYLDAERFANPQLSVRGGIPILFPICGNLPDNTYTYNERQYTLKQHGFARDLPWEVTEQVTQEQASITLVLDSNEITRAVYPFDFQLAFTYQLLGNKLAIAQCLTNHSTVAMPFSVGIHPYFLVHDKTQLQFTIPATKYQDQRTKTNHSFTGHFDFQLDEIDAVFRPLNAANASVRDANRGLKLQMSWNDAHYKTFVFWTQKGKDFYCIEPWTAPRNALNTGTDLISLEPDASLNTWVNMEVTFL